MNTSFNVSLGKKDVILPLNKLLNPFFQTTAWGVSIIIGLI